MDCGKGKARFFALALRLKILDSDGIVLSAMEDIEFAALGKMID